MSIGCEEHTATITDSKSGVVVCTLDQLLEVSWERIMDEPSPAQVIAGAGGDCCECLGDIRPWRHTLTIRYGGEVVWSGPVVRVEWSTEVTTIFAFDTSAWLARRVLDVPLSFVATDLTDVATGLIAAGFVQDDPGHVVTVAARSGVVDDREYEANDGTVLDALRDLGSSGLDWTVIGTRIVLLAEGFACDVVGSLTDGDFPDGLTVVEDGLSFCSEVIVKGDGVVGRAGGTDPFYGLTTCVVEADTVKTVAGANATAATQVDASSPAALFITVPDDSTLHPDADIELASLIPGWCVTVRTSETCRTLEATLRIIGVRGGETPDGGTRLGITFAPPGLDSGGSL